MVKVSVTIVSNLLPAMPAKAKAGARQVVQKTVFDVEAGCKVRSRVDTGEMRDRWQGRMTGEAEGEVVNDSDHVLPNEYGTVHMSAQPMARPAADAARPGFESGMRQVLEGLA